MPSLITSYQTERSLRQLLEMKGYKLSPPLPSGYTGCDIVAQKGSQSIYIEVIGYKSSGPARARDFFQSFFRAISRIKDGANYCVIAMPSLAKRGLFLRAHHYGQAWCRISAAFPELEIWLIDVDELSYEKTSWNSWY